MIKRLYLVNGNLTKPLDINEEDIAVDANTATQLSILNIGDWCYLTIIEGNKLEVIKITKFPSWYWVDRGQDGTDQFSFSTQAKIVYLLTAQEIEDAVSGTPLNIYPNGYGALEVNTGVNSWQISYTELSIQTLGGISWMNPDGYEIVITDNNGMFGCCDGSLTGAPYAGGVPFYLTSQLYSFFTVEQFVGVNESNKATIPPLNIDNPWYLLVQPVINQDWTSLPISINSWNMFGGAATFSATEPVYISSYINTNDWNMFGGAVTFSATEPVYVSMDAYVLDMESFGAAIVYSGYDGYISMPISVNNWAYV